MKHLALALTLGLLPGLAAAQDFSGVYQMGDCGAMNSDTRVTISGGTIMFHESACQLTNPTGVRDMGDATLFDVMCSGEGETWSYRTLMMRGEQGLVMLRDGHAFTYQRCG